MSSVLRDLRKVGDRVGSLDRRAVWYIGRQRRSRLDQTLLWLTSSADHSKLWFAIGAGLALRKGPQRRAAVRGIAAIAATSVATNLVAKQCLPRRRPAARMLPGHRRLVDPPSSSSFPSGHAASAAAFTTAVCMEAPAVGVVVAPIAAAVAYSRVDTGVHWPSDVVAGACVGMGLGLATRRWWPVRPATPGLARPSEQVARLEQGEGLLLLSNPGAGTSDDNPLETLERLWPQASFLQPDLDVDLGKQLHEAIDQAPRPIRAVGVAGGDGTIAAAASVAADRQLPLVVVPAGTLNHFAQDVGIAGPGDAARACADGSAVHVDLGNVEVDGAPPRWFVNTASLGGYPDMVRLREGWEGEWGKWPAATLALIQVLARTEPMTVRIDGLKRKIWLLFVGNSGYQPKGFAPSWRPKLDDRVLDIRYIRADLPFSRSRFVLAALTGALFNSRTYVQEERDRLRIDVLSEPVALACDGEVYSPGSSFEFTAQDKALRVYRPANATR